MDADHDMVAAMARELVEKGGVGDSADAVWEELRKRTDSSSPTNACRRGSSGNGNGVRNS